MSAYNRSITKSAADTSHCVWVGVTRRPQRPRKSYPGSDRLLGASPIIDAFSSQAPHRMSEAMRFKKNLYMYIIHKSLAQRWCIPHMHYGNCDSTDECTLFILKALFLKTVVFKVGIRGHLSESYWRLSTLFRPPWFTAKRVSRLSSWFTWSKLNVKARGECGVKIKCFILPSWWK